jgi:hypothetical protein
MNDTSRVAMFVGAGASKEFKAPLTNEIFPKIRQKPVRKLCLGCESEDFEGNQSAVGKVPGSEGEG